MEKFKAGDVIIIKDDFLKSLDIRPIEISEHEIPTESGKPYYIERGFYGVVPLAEKELMSVDELGAVDIWLSDSQYYNLLDYLREKSTVLDRNFNKFSYYNCIIVLFRPREGYKMSVKLTSGNMGNFIQLGIDIGGFFGSIQDKIKEEERLSNETRRLQENEQARLNRSWNDYQDQHPDVYEDWDKENDLHKSDEYNPRNWTERD